MQGGKQHVHPRERGRPRRRPTCQIIADILSEFFAGTAGPLSVAVGGPGGTGKTTFARQLAEILGDAAVLPLDDYKTSRSHRESAGVFGPHPEANKMAEITGHLACVKRGETFDMPVYDRELGDAIQVREYRPRRFNLVDGEVSTYREFRGLVDFSIFIDSDWRTQLATRLGRDLRQRSYSPEKAVATFLNSNLREFKEHGAASKNWADIHLFCHEDYRLELESVSRDLYERVWTLLHDEMEPLLIGGLIVPILSPFTDEGIDRRAFVEHLDWLAAAGVRRVLVGGTTGEFFSLSEAEKIELLQLSLEYFPGLTLFQVGGGALCDAARLARRAAGLGVDAALCLPPGYYANAPANGLATYFHEVAAALGNTPLILYNFPRHTQNLISSAILERVPHFGMKDSSGDLSLIGATPKYFVGDDGKILDALLSGAAGFVSAAANVEPGAYVEIEKMAETGRLDTDEARNAAEEIKRLNSRIGGSQIPAMKALLRQAIANYPATVRPPLECIGKPI